MTNEKKLEWCAIVVSCGKTALASLFVIAILALIFMAHQRPGMFSTSFAIIFVMLEIGRYWLLCKARIDAVNNRK